MLQDRVAIITGAGRGIGREHALLFASLGAKVVVNDLGGSTSGEGSDTSAAQEVVDEITAAGGQAVASTHSVTSWDDAKAMVDLAVETFGDLHVVVNNAGILRDRMFVSMGEDEFDAVVAVHLKGTFNVGRHAAGYWREQAKEGKEAHRAIVNTSSGSGLHGNPGQLNYAAAKAGIAAMTVVQGMELKRYGVRSNCIAPVARTRLTLQTPGWARPWATPSSTPRTSRRLSLCSRRRSVTSTVRSSPCTADRSGSTPAGRSPNKSRPKTAGRSRALPRRCRSCRAVFRSRSRWKRWRRTWQRADVTVAGAAGGDEGRGGSG